MAWFKFATGSGISKASFMTISTDSIPISIDPDASSIVTGISFEQNSGHWQLEAALGGVRNISGRTIVVQKGLVSSHTVSANASIKLVSIFSERSSDGISWTKNTNSGRTGSVAGTSEQYGSKSSEAFSILDGEIVRFKFFTDGVNVSLEPVSFLADGDTVTGPSFRWRLEEI